MDNKYTIIGDSLPNIPWEEKPADCKGVVWRSQKNPIIPRDLLPNSNSIFNSAVVPFKEEFAGVFRCDDTGRYMRLHSGTSKDGIHWEINSERIQFVCEDPEIGRFDYGYDPRVCWIEDRYYITWCNGYHGPTIGVGYTYDFETFYQLENAFLPFNRNGVMFPRKINGKYAMLSRPSDNGHIYTIPYVLKAPAVPFNPYINQKWLQAVGKDMPTTTDELIEVLRAFRDEDPNGNGEKDEIPWSGDNFNGYLGLFAGWFGMPCPKSNFTMVDGKLTFAANTESFKSAMKFFRQLNDEELLDPEFFTQDNAQWKAKGNQNLYGVCGLWCR
jgi:hypothetical protein